MERVRFNSIRRYSYPVTVTGFAVIFEQVSDRWAICLLRYIHNISLFLSLIQNRDTISNGNEVGMFTADAVGVLITGSRLDPGTNTTSIRRISLFLKIVVIAYM